MPTIGEGTWSESVRESARLRGTNVMTTYCLNVQEELISLERTL